MHKISSITSTNRHAYVVDAYQAGCRVLDFSEPKLNACGSLFLQGKKNYVVTKRTLVVKAIKMDGKMRSYHVNDSVRVPRRTLPMYATVNIERGRHCC